MQSNTTLIAALAALSLSIDTARSQTIVQQFPVSYANAFVGGVGYDRITDEIWVADETNRLFTRYTRTGTQLAQFGVPTVPGITAPLPIGIKVHPRTGSVWVVDEAEVVYEMTRAGVLLRSWSARPSIVDASAIALDPETSSVYVSNDSSRIIGQFDENGVSIRTFSVVAAGSTDPDGLAFNQVTRTFYLGEDTLDAIIEVDMNGVLIRNIPMNGVPVSPEGVDVDTKTGSLFVGGGFVQRAVLEIAGIVPVPTIGRATPYGTGCPDSGGTIPRLAAAEVPNVGTHNTIAVQGSPSVTTFAWFVLGTSRFNLPLDSFGAIGCTLHSDPGSVSAPMPVVEGRAGFSFNLAASPGFPVTLSAIFLPDGTANGIGLAASNGIEIVFQ